MTPFEAFNACKDTELYYRLLVELPQIIAKQFTGQIIKMSPEEAYETAKNNPNADIEKCQEAACKDPYFACQFVLNIPNADIKKCQEAACKNSIYAYCFARDILKANIISCQKAACKDPNYAYLFAQNIPGADIDYCLNACKDTELYYRLLKEHPQIIAKQLTKRGNN